MQSTFYTNILLDYYTFEFILGWRRSIVNGEQIYISHFSNKTLSSAEFKEILGLEPKHPNENCVKVGQSLAMTNCSNNEVQLRGLCQYKECITTENKPCSFPFKYKGRMYDSCITIDSTEPWCSLKTDIHRNHIEDTNNRGTCTSSCNVQNCPVGYFKHHKTCLRISARTDHDSWISTEQADFQCMKEGGRLFQPRDIKSFRSLLISEFEHLQPNQSHFAYKGKESFIALGARANFSLISYLDGSRSYMLESIMNDQGNLLKDNDEEKCIMLDKTGKLALTTCDDYFDGQYSSQAQLGYICEAKHIITKGGKTCVFPFKKSSNSKLHTSCIYDNVKESSCATSVDNYGVVQNNELGLCMDERQVAYDCPGSGEECIIPFIYDGIWRDSCALKPKDNFWCPTKLQNVDENTDLIESNNEWGYCTDFLSPSLDCPETYENVNNTCVRVSVTTADHTAAEEKCIEDGGALISIASEKFHLAVVDHIGTLSSKQNYRSTVLTNFWIGGSITNNSWTWDLQNIDENWIENVVSGCPGFKCTESYGLTMNISHIYLWKAELKTIELPYICALKCRAGYRWGFRTNKCIRVEGKAPGMSNTKSMLSCSQEKSRLVSVSSCQDFSNLLKDLRELAPDSEENYWIGYFVGNFQHYDIRKIGLTPNLIKAINSKGMLAPTDCDWDSFDINSVGFITINSEKMNLSSLSDVNILKGFICEEENEWICPDGYILFQEECYMLINDSLIFTEALVRCLSDGGQLAEPKHELHVNFLQAYCEDNQINQQNFWTGYRQNIFNITDSENTVFTSSDFKKNDFPADFFESGISKQYL